MKPTEKAWEETAMEMAKELAETLDLLSFAYDRLEHLDDGIDTELYEWLKKVKPIVYKQSGEALKL